MPAQLELLGENKVHLLAAYVWGLGGGQKPAPVQPEVAPEVAAEPAAPEAAAPSTM
jgi:hypothetical protein